MDFFRFFFWIFFQMNVANRRPKSDITSVYKNEFTRALLETRLSSTSGAEFAIYTSE